MEPVTRIERAASRLQAERTFLQCLTGKALVHRFELRFRGPKPRVTAVAPNQNGTGNRIRTGAISLEN